MISGHDTEKLQHLLDMLHLSGRWDIVPISLLLDEVICHDPEVALEEFNLLLRIRRKPDLFYSAAFTASTAFASASVFTVSICPLS